MLMQRSLPLFGATLLFAAALWLWNAESRLQAQNRAAVPSESTAESAARIEVNAFASGAESAALDSVCRLPASASQNAPIPTDWLPSQTVRLRATSSAESLPVYALRSANGASVCIVNHGETRAAFRLTARLPRGVYTVERLVFYPLAPVTPETFPRVERLESVILSGTRAAVKPGWLKPGAAAIYRWINRNAETAESFRGVKARAQSLRRAHPAEFRRLKAPLQECEAHIGRISGGISPEKRAIALKSIHRALLTVSHAQMLCRNFRNQQRLPLENADTLKASLDRLEASLTALSVGCLNLVSNIIIESPTQERPAFSQVTISVTNAGQQSVSFVKLGIEAPTEAVVQPAEQAFFSALGPGQTARATFRTRLDAETAARQLLADIAYYAARAPDHLRLKAI